MKLGFVVIHDYNDSEHEETVEGHYGYFDSIEQAERLYKDMISGDSGYSNAHVCAIVKEIR